MGLLDGFVEEIFVDVVEGLEGSVVFIVLVYGWRMVWGKLCELEVLGFEI